jgi:ElaB/YqjD/DUF883 family membrane-anchored ribosome-binding protein
MGESADELRRDIEATRGGLTDTLDAIGDRVSPGAVDTVKETPQLVRQQTQGSPLAAGAIAFGVGFLVAAILPASAPEQRAAEGLLDSVEPLKDELASAGREVVGGVRDVAEEAVHEVKTTATDGTQAVADTVRDSVDTTKTTTQDAISTVKGEAAPSPN